MRATYVFVQHIAGSENRDDMPVEKEICRTVRNTEMDSRNKMNDVSGILNSALPSPLEYHKAAARKLARKKYYPCPFFGHIGLFWFCREKSFQR